MSTGKFFDVLKELETLIRTAPKQASLARFSELVREPVLNRYAFSALKDPRWIGALASMGFFTSPPEPNRDLEKGTVSFSVWPESQFLARMSAKSPQEVCELFLAMPATENEMTHRDIVDASLVMRGELAARIAWKENEWLRGHTRVIFVILATNFGKLIRHLAQETERDVAFELARSLFQIMPDPRPEAKSRDMYTLPEPRTRVDIWNYGRLLRDLIPVLTGADDKATLTLVCDLLDSSVRMSLKPNGDAESEDYSTIWCPMVEHADSGAPDVKRTLVSAVWETLLLLANRDEGVSSLVAQLEEKRWNVFRRLALALLREFSGEAGELIAVRLTDRRLFESVSLGREYRMLLEHSFGRLGQEEQQVYLNWVQQGPDVDGFEKRYQKVWGSAPLTEAIDQYVKIWLSERLSPVCKFLSGDLLVKYDEVIAELGKPRGYEFPTSVGRFGAQYTLTSNIVPDFSSMEVIEIAEYLRSLQPSRDASSQIPQGIDQVLTSAVIQNPTRFAEQARMFEGLAATYVAALLLGLEQTLRLAERKQFSWENLLPLLKWAVEQPASSPGSQLPSDEPTSNWSWTRNTIARLLSAGLEVKASEIPYLMRSAVWSVLRVLSRDPDPGSETDSGGSTVDQLTVSINSVRGNALHAVIRYALWVRRHLDQQRDATGVTRRGFLEMPEVQELLDERLDPTKEQALSIRTVYGQWLPWLVSLDPVWVREKVDRIFPLTGENKRFGETAWNSYISVCQPFESVFDILREQYLWAVRRIGADSEERSHLPDPIQRLGDHLMVFYWRGKVSLDDDLITSFYARAGASVRGESLEFIGRSLKEAESVPEVVAKRLKELWAWRFKTAQAADSKKDLARELAAFGWWFSSGKMENIWSVEELSKALQLMQQTNPAHLVIERLAEISQEAPVQCLTCMRLIVEGDSEGFILAGSEEHCRKVLSAGLSAADAQTREYAEDVIHILGASGYLSFGDLLSRRDS